MEVIKILVVWPSLLVIPTTIFSLLAGFVIEGLNVFNDFSFATLISRGLFLQACIFLLSAPFTLLFVFLFVFDTLKSVYRALNWFLYHYVGFAIKPVDDTVVDLGKLLAYVAFYTPLYFYYIIGALVFNATNIRDFKLDLLDPFSLTYQLLSILIRMFNV